jgi:UPF0716 protein FxsA
MNPALVLLLLFIGAPLLELYVMIEVGARIGALSTVLLVVSTALVGGLLVRRQGFAALLRVRSMLDRGEAPADAMLEAVLLLIGGGLLLLPGFITDALGAVLLIPSVRHRLALHWLESRVWVVEASSPRKQDGAAPPGKRVIQGVCKREDE